MNKTAKRDLAIVATGILLVAGPANAHEESSAATEHEAAMVLHVINYATLSRAALDVAKARVAVIYELIGVRIVWIDSEETVAQREDGRRHLTVLLLSRDMAERKISAEHIKDGVLAQAHLPSRRAHIFCDRIATTPGAPRHLPIPLGDVIAHEVGHLLLGTNSHSPGGIMRARMDLQFFHLRSFDQRQAAVIRTSLMN